MRWLMVVAIGLVFALGGCGGEAETETEGGSDVDSAAVESGPDLDAEVPQLAVGHCMHDHHSAVFVSALRGERMRELFGIYLVPLGEDFYALVEDGEKIAEIELIQSQGAINVPNNMVAGMFEVGFGGVIPFAASADQGSGVRINPPLHTRGDMLVVPWDNQEVTDWESFLGWVESSEEPVVVGFKSPKAVAVLIFEMALDAEGVAYSMHGNPAEGSKILLYNAQGIGNLNPALQNGTIDAYISNNPACAMAEHNQIGRCVAELCTLPPGDFANHPCCAIASTETAIAEKPEEIAALLRLFAAATEYINDNPEDAAEVAAEYLGNPVEVEVASMATSGYDMHSTDHWMANMEAIVGNMRDLGVFSGPLAVDDWEQNEALICDFSLLPEELIL